ncbi:hypothetical protein VTK73DRAFT_1418 [Phialemonium thermophilum]|uniref:Uncharacterized protein n=1 Tax=Phialemonium thermophilum TaxID=223376 RepID=A0ABR3VTH4_9PEZI
MQATPTPTVTPCCCRPSFRGRTKESKDSSAAARPRHDGDSRRTATPAGLLPRSLQESPQYRGPRLSDARYASPSSSSFCQIWVPRTKDGLRQKGVPMLLLTAVGSRRGTYLEPCIPRVLRPGGLLGWIDGEDVLVQKLDAWWISAFELAVCAAATTWLSFVAYSFAAVSWQSPYLSGIAGANTGTKAEKERRPGA